MLRRFSVKNFRGFEKKLVFDLQKVNDYQFNKECIKNGIANKVFIYGKNGSGKSNLGFAIFDIVMTITDKSKNMISNYSNYNNLDSEQKEVEFKYEFQFDNDELIYFYKKLDINTMLYEEVIYNGKTILKYDFNDKDNKIIEIDEAQNLNWKNEQENNNISIVKYIFNNTMLSIEHPISKLMKFVNGMLWFRSVRFNEYIGIRNGSESLNDIIFKKDKLKDFEIFLKDKGINYNLEKLEETTGTTIGIKFKNGIARFERIVSTGTIDLWLYYCWMLMFEEVNFLYIDEFDSNYHFELAADVIKYMNKLNNLQSIVTTHNVSLMTNKLTRPDCVFIIANNKINNLSNCTPKELREAHNIEKLYREGCFTE